MTMADLGHDLTQFLDVTRGVYRKLHGDKHTVVAEVTHEVITSTRSTALSHTVSWCCGDKFPIYCTDSVDDDENYHQGDGCYYQEGNCADNTGR